MGTTYDALTSRSGVRIQTTAVIEGIPWILTDGDPTLANAAYQASTSAGLADFGALNGGTGGLSVSWDIDQRASPWKPFMEPSIVKFSVVPATTHSAPTVISDRVGQTVFKRSGGTETHITANLDCDDTTITCQRVDDFSAIGYLYAGPELLHTSARDTAADTFTADVRGQCSPFSTYNGTRFARTHKPTTYTSPTQNVGLNPIIGTEPRTWIGRWVAIWLHRYISATGGIDAPNEDQSAAHLAFAGQIVSVEDVNGATVFTCEDVRRKIYETTIMRDPFRARVREGVRLNTGMTFSCSTVRITSGGGTSGTANVLTVVAGAPASANEVQAGHYTDEELARVLNEWLQNERLFTRTLFTVRIEPRYQESNGAIRSRITYFDPTATALQRTVVITCTAFAYIQFLGWSSGSITITNTARTAGLSSPNPPLRAWIWSSNSVANQRLLLDQPRGSFVSQTTLLPQSLRDPSGLINGVLRINGVGYVRAGRISDTEFYYSPHGVEAFFTGTSFTPNMGNAFAVTIEDDISLEVEQVLVITAPFKSLLLRMLLSTGTANFNDNTYDNLSEPMGCAIPHSLLKSAFVTEVSNLDCADMELTAIVRKPTRFAELFEADFILRRCFFVWGQGRLRIGTWSSPNSGFATVALTETSKATPSGTADVNRSQVIEEDDYYNIVKIAYSPDAEGKLQDEVVLVDATSVRNHGERAITINARNTFRYQGAIGAPMDELVAIYSGYFKYTSNPTLLVRRSIDFNQYEQCIPGTVLSLTDKYVRDPATGLRYSHMTTTGGLSGYPGLVVRCRYDYGGTESGYGGAPTTRPPGGEIDVMISAQRTQGAYAPCAQVDDTAGGAGYNAGTKVLTLYAHKFSEASEANDNTHFAVGDEVLVHEIDPSNPAAPLSWSDVIAGTGTNTLTLTTGLGGFDTTKKYRVTYDAYATVGAGQRSKCYQADDADGLVADSVQAYGFSSFATAQGTVTPTAVAPTETPSRYAQLAYGDGKPLDVGFDTDVMRLAQTLLHYKTAPQQPSIYTDVRTYGSGTWNLVELQPIFVGKQDLGGVTRALTVAVQMRSTTGGSASVRVRLCRLRPTGATPADVSFIDPYQSVTFTSTSTTFSVPASQTLDISHLKLSEAANGGWGWLTVELSSVAEYRGLARCVLGAAA